MKYYVIEAREKTQITELSCCSEEAKLEALIYKFYSVVLAD